MTEHSEEADSLELDIGTITYNVNGQKSCADAVRQWLEPEKRISKCQFICIALQEVPHSDLVSLAGNSWVSCLVDYFSDRDFILTYRNQLASNLLLVFSTMNMLSYLHRIQTRWSRQSMAGHKGTLSCRLEFKNGFSLVFITSHFVHGELNLQQRIDQCRSSLSCTFDDDISVLKQRRTIFWLGDFNFRIDGFDGSATEMIDKIDICGVDKAQRIKLIQEIIEFDQLTKCKRKGVVFAGFSEPPITFLPTYRMLVNSGTYDALRMPSWCDRIFYATGFDNRLTVEKYDTTRWIQLSDHLPVCAFFRLRAKRECAVRNTNGAALRCFRLPLTRGGLAHFCRFEPIPSWTTLVPFVCRFRVDVDFWRIYGSYCDWIGVYPARVGAISRPLQWIYLLCCYADTVVNGGNLSTPSAAPSLLDDGDERWVAEFVALAPGEYRVGYYSKQMNCLHGLSNVFVVKALEERLG